MCACVKLLLLLCALVRLDKEEVRGEGRVTWPKEGAQPLSWSVHGFTPSGSAVQTHQDGGHCNGVWKMKEMDCS